MKMIEGLYYTLSVKGEGGVIAYYYKNPDFYRPNTRAIDPDLDYGELGFGFNVADGGGFLPVFDVKEGTEVKLSFGQALEAMKVGCKVARLGWNGSGMYAVLMRGYPDGVPANLETAGRHGLSVGDRIKIRPYYALFTAQKDVAQWAPSGSDTMADDWVIV